MNGALPPYPMPALGAGDVSLSDIQQRAGDLAGQMQIAPSAALRAALVEARNGGAATVGGADITEAIRKVRPTPPASADPATLGGATPSNFHPNPWDLPALAQEAWGRAKDFGAAVEQGLTRPIAGVIGAVALGDHFLTGTPLNDTASKQFADSLNDYWNKARNPDDTDSTLSKVTGAAAPIIPSLLVARYGGGAAGAIFNALSMGGEAMLEAKEKGWTDSEAMQMFGLNLGFGAIGGTVISRSLNRINALTGGSLSRYILSLARENALGLLPAARAGLAAGQSALEGGLFGAAQSFGSEAWAKLRNLGGTGQREWSAILNDAKTAGVQNALTMALTTIFAAGAIRRRNASRSPGSQATKPRPQPRRPLRNRSSQARAPSRSRKLPTPPPKITNHRRRRPSPRKKIPRRRPPPRPSQSLRALPPSIRCPSAWPISTTRPPHSEIRSRQRTMPLRRRRSDNSARFSTPRRTLTLSSTKRPRI
jgi:hypothetical protein